MSICMEDQILDEAEDSFEIFLSTDICETVRTEIRDDTIVKTTLTEYEKILKEIQDEQENDDLEYDLVYEKCPVCCSEKVSKKEIKIQHIKVCYRKNFFTPDYVVELMKMCKTKRVIKNNEQNKSPTKSKRKRVQKNEIFEIQLFDMEYKRSRFKSRLNRIIENIPEAFDFDNETSEYNELSMKNIKNNNFKPEIWELSLMSKDHSSYVVSGFENYFVLQNL